MNLKQGFSVAAAAALPALALCGYLYFGPTRALAFSQCPDGGIFDPAANDQGNNMFCGSGMGGGTPIGSSGNFPTVCPAGTHEGECVTGQCVICDE